MTSAPREKPGLIKASSLLFVITIMGNLCNYAFHAVASRTLGPADYGALVSMLALLMVVSIPGQALQIVMAKQVAVDEMTQALGRITAFLRFMLLRTSVVGGAIWLALAVSSHFWKQFLHLDAAWPVVAVGGAGLIFLMQCVVRGTLQGFQYFTHLGFNMLIDGVLRLAIGGLFFWLSLGITGGVVAGALSGLLAFLLAGWPLKHVIGKTQQAVDAGQIRDVGRFGVRVLIVLGAFLLLSNLDVIMVKHYFAAKQAGYYSAASIIGKAFLFLPYAVAQVLFPKVSAGMARREGTRGLLDNSLLITGGIIACGIAAVWLLAPLIVLTLFGRDFLNPETLYLVKGFSMAVAPLAMLYILLQYNLAAKRNRFVAVLFAEVPVLLGALVMFHRSLTQVLWAVGISHSVFFIASYFVTPGNADAKP